jgi:hypothetical protein
MEKTCKTCFHKKTKSCSDNEMCGYWYWPNLTDSEIGYKYTMPKRPPNKKEIRRQRIISKDTAIIAAYNKEHNYI